MNKSLLVVFLALLIYGWNYWGTSIYTLDEAKNAGSAVEMMRRGDPFVPTFNDEYHDKPGLQYLFFATAYKLFGINPFSARFFSVIFGVLLVLTVYQFVKRILNKSIAFYTSLILIASLQLTIQFRMAVPDPFLLFFLTLGLLSFYVGYSEKKVKFLYLFYVSIGFGFVAKGPIAFALPGLIVLIFLLLRKDFSWRTLMSLKIIQGGLLSLLVALPWYIGVGLVTDWKWLEYFFITHNLERYTTTFEGHGGFLFDGVVIVFAALLPASIFFPQALRQAWSARKQEPFILIALSACIAVIGFFFFSKTVLPSYVEPCVPFAAILLAKFIYDSQHSAALKSQKLWINGIAFCVIAVAMPIAAVIALQLDPELKDLYLRGLYFLIVPVGAFVGLYFLRKQKVQHALYVYTGTFMILLVLISMFALPQVDAKNPVVRSVKLIEEYNRPMAYYKRINSAYVFQLGKSIKKLDNEAELDTFVKQNGKVIIISAEGEWSELNKPEFKVVFKAKDLFESPVSLVAVN
jgi:4-amino-4-deoxy-L-arabinose transferase-like glycosyltransferase